MSTPEESWWSIRAGEYVLGTLRGEDLKLFEKILAHDTTVQAEVAYWEKQLASLNEQAPAKTPGPHVWPEILDRVRQLETADTPNAPVSDVAAREAIAGELTRPPTTISDHKRKKAASRFSIWPTIAGLATAASVVLGVLLVQQSSNVTRLPMNVDGLAVVLSDESGEPYFLVETDYGNLRVRVTALAPPSLDDSRDFQLWQALPDRSSVRPVALLPEEPGASRVFDVSSLINGSDLFGVSIEPVGAETEEGPTGPVVAHGDFLPTQKIDE